MGQERLSSLDVMAQLCASRARCSCSLFSVRTLHVLTCVAMKLQESSRSVLGSKSLVR